MSARQVCWRGGGADPWGGNREGSEGPGLAGRGEHELHSQTGAASDAAVLTATGVLASTVGTSAQQTVG